MSNMHTQIKQLINLLKQGEGEKLEFKQGVSNITHDICAFLNTQGGTILVGINDQGEITSAKKTYKQKISDLLAGIDPVPQATIETIKINKKEILIVKIAKSDKLHSVGNRIYIRLGSNNRPLSTQEIIEKAGEGLRIFFDELPCLKAKLKDIDENKVKFYLEQREKIRGVKMQGTVRENMKLLKIIDQKSKPTNAGILFFAKQPQKFIPHSCARLVDFFDQDMDRYKDSKEFSGTIPEMVEQIGKYWANNLKNLGGALIGFKRQEFFEYPLAGLREALINALIHRNYFDASDIRIFVFPDKLLIKNPGAFPPGITPEKPEHKPRNPLLSQYMYDLGYIEKYGRGILKIQKECHEHPLVNIYFILKPFITTLDFRKEKNVQIDKLSEKIIQILKSEPKRSSEIARSIDISKQTVLDRLEHLSKLGIVLQKGNGPETRYLIK